MTEKQPVSIADARLRRRASDRTAPVVAVVVPCYRVKLHILWVLDRIGPEVSQIFVVDDACPEGTGKHVLEQCNDSRVEVLFHDNNLGVGGATCTGYKKAIEAGADILVKVDGDGQIDPGLIPTLVLPIQEGRADYTKGNRFFNLKDLGLMPWPRRFGNSVLSLLSKVSTGYWSTFDPTNGFTALHTAVARELDLDHLSKRFFFESDLLFRLNTLRAVALDVPMRAYYGDESSNLRVRSAILEFGYKHVVNLIKRIFYNYFLREFNIASLELIIGLVAFTFGTSFGLLNWSQSLATTEPATSGTVMLAALPVIVGVQLLLAFLNYDIQHTPSNAIHRALEGAWKTRLQSQSSYSERSARASSS